MGKLDIVLCWTENGNRRERLWKSELTEVETRIEIERLKQTRIWQVSWVWFQIRTAVSTWPSGFIPQTVPVENPVQVRCEEVTLIRKFGFTLEAQRLTNVLMICFGHRNVRRCWCSTH